MNTPQIYRFYNQYRHTLYEGKHYSASEAWNAFFDHCKYPHNKRDINIVKESGIYVEIVK